MDLKEISTFSVYKLGSCNVSCLVSFCFFFPFILMQFSNCMSFHFKERSALSCSGHPVFWSWIPLLLQIFLGFKRVKSTGAESSLWQSFHTSVVQVPTKPMQHLCLLSKNGVTVLSFCTASANAKAWERGTCKLSAIRSVEMTVLFTLSYFSLVLDPLTLSHPVLCSFSLLWMLLPLALLLANLWWVPWRSGLTNSL